MKMDAILELKEWNTFQKQIGNNLNSFILVTMF